MSALVLTIAIGFLAWFWAANLNARERALEISRAACLSSGVQFLDQTVSIHRIGLGRAESGHLQLHRVYSFEFTIDGDKRWNGQVAMQGTQVKAVHLDHPDGTLIIQPNQL